MNDDLDLLLRYGRDRCEDSFAELVSRHLDLVYSVAVRQVQSPQLAEEVTQSVFMIMARNASQMKPDTVLAAWLYHVTRRTAINLARSESRRHLREQAAQELAGLKPESPHWAGIEPLLDEALDKLEQLDRSAILLRFFEGRSLREVGEALGTSEDAARKRISRAVDQLRDCFSARGVVVPGAGLAALLAANAVQGAPVGLGAAICTNALLGGIHTSGTLTIAKTIAMTTTQKVILTASVAALAVGVAVNENHRVASLRSQLQALRQQQEPLAADLQDIQRQRDAATNGLQLAEDQIQQLRRDTAEMPKLRGELTRWRNTANGLTQATAVDAPSDPTESMAKAWATQVKQLKQHADEWPGRKIPELQLVNDQAWFDAVGQTNSLQSDADFRQALDRLRCLAKGRFASLIQNAFRGYADANDGRLPADLSQLQPFLDPSVNTAMLQRYQLLQSGKLSDLPPNQPVLTELAAVDDQFDEKYFIMMNGAGASNW